MGQLVYIPKPAATFSATGATVNSSGQPTIVYNTFVTLNITADTTNYPGSTVTSGTQLNSGGTKASATIAASVPFSGGFFGGGGTIRVLLNGTVIATGAEASGSGGTATVSTTHAIASTDYVQVQFEANGSPVPAIGSGGWLRIT